MAISDKLNYLIETKQLFKDRLNSLGAEITSSTTFRNYLIWLDTFYGEVSDKTDISQNGIVGRTSQESTTGKNLLYLASQYDYGQNRVNGAYNETDGSFTITGTATASTNSQITRTIPLELTAGTYTFSLDHSISKQIYLHFNLVGSGGPTQNLVIPAGETEVTDTLTADTTGYNIRFSTTNGNTYNEKVYMQLESGSSATSWEKFTYGASPNPDYPQPINNLSGDVAYKISGKNLLDIQSYLKQSDRGIIPTYNQDGSVTLSGTATTNYSNFARNISDVLEKNKTYTLSVIGTKNFAIGCRLFYSDNTNEDFNITSNNTYVNITPTKDVSDFRIYMYSLTSGTSYNSILYFQIEKGSTATTYEPYIEPQTFDIPLGDIELCKIDTYEDKIYSSDGRFYLYKNIGKETDDGSNDENWYKLNRQINGCYGFRHNGSYSEILLCDKLTNYTAAQLYQGIGEGIGYSSAGGYLAVYIKAERVSSYDSAALRAFLSNNPITYYYQLSTSTTTEITQENYPSLYNALKQIQDYLTSYKINKEFILGYSSPEIEY